MRSHLFSILTVLAVAAVGLVLWLTTGDVDTPVIALSKLGVVAMVLGVVEVVWSGVALARYRSEVPRPRRSGT